MRNTSPFVGSLWIETVATVYVVSVK
jgi:hypothetical protein